MQSEPSFSVEYTLHGLDRPSKLYGYKSLATALAAATHILALCDSIEVVETWKVAKHLPWQTVRHNVAR